MPTRTLSASDLGGFLRVAVGLPPSEDSVSTNRTPITIDAEAWAAWCLAGLELCALPGEAAAAQGQQGPWVPAIRDAAEAGRRFVANLAIERHGSITRAAANAGTSRRALRSALKRAGTYQPPAYTTEGAEGEATPRRRRQASQERAVGALDKLANGMSGIDAERATQVLTRTDGHDGTRPDDDREAHGEGEGHEAGEGGA